MNDNLTLPTPEIENQQQPIVLTVSGRHYVCADDLLSWINERIERYEEDAKCVPQDEDGMKAHISLKAKIRMCEIISDKVRIM